VSFLNNMLISLPSLFNTYVSKYIDFGLVGFTQDTLQEATEDENLSSTQDPLKAQHLAIRRRSRTKTGLGAITANPQTEFVHHAR
jgi:hypothetical protein